MSRKSPYPEPQGTTKAEQLAWYVSYSANGGGTEAPPYVWSVEDVVAAMEKVCKLRQRQVLRLRWLTDGPALTQKEVGAIFGVTQSTVQQSESGAIERLGRYLRAVRARETMAMVPEIEAAPHADNGEKGGQDA